jgi:hypothetical protein
VTGDPVRRIARRRDIIAALRASADASEEAARDARARADRLEASTNALAAATGVAR